MIYLYIKPENKSHRYLSYLARSILYYGLLKENKIDDISNIKIEIYRNGKPYIDGVNFNISHCSEVIAVDISESSTGIDVCDYRILDDKVINKIFTENEKELIKKDRKNAYMFWACRESLCKNTGEGLNARILSTDFSLIKENRIQMMYNKFFYVKKFDSFVISICRDKIEDISVNILHEADLISN